MAGCWQYVKGWSPLLVVVLTPLLLLPLPLIVNTPEGKTAFVLFVMAVYWVTEAVPIAVTALLPAVLFPMMDIVGAKVIAKSYMSDLLLLFVGGLMVAVAVERWNLHRRIALRILLSVGSEPRWLMLGLMLATWFLSMWISNTATTAMMIPITEAILQQLKGTFTDDSDSPKDDVDISESKETTAKQQNGSTPDPLANGVSSPRDPESGENIAKNRQFELMSKGMSLCICYAANCGGIATLTGTGPNLVLKENADKLYEEHGLKSPVNFATWMGLGLPLSALVLVVVWVWLQLVFLRCRGLFQCCRQSEEKKAQGKRVRNIIKLEYQKLGPVTFAESAVLFWFGLLVVLWISRDLGGVGGWGDLFPDGTVSDATPALLVGTSLFFFPSHNPFRRQPRGSEVNTAAGQTVERLEEDSWKLVPLLQWSDVHKKMPWGLLLLLGGGFALSDGCRISGLSEWIGTQLEVFSSVNKWGMLFILCYITAAMTEVTSNTAISILLLPILANLAINTGVHPLYYMFPAALACSFAFMLPVATPPNAIVFSYGHVRVVDMIAAGIALNILAVPLLVLAVGTWGDALFDFTDIPAALLNTTASAIATQ